MALLNFNYGLVKDLPSSVIDGNLYITTDSQGLYVDLDGSRIHVSDFIQVETVEALNALSSYSTKVFYYVSGSNALMKYTGDATTPWKQLNSTADLTAEINLLKQRLTQVESDIDVAETAITAVNTRIDGLNATHIETTNEITVTKAVGNYSVGTKIAADTDLQTLILNMLCKDVNPSTTQPSITSVTLSGAGAKEVGTTFSPSYTINTDAGKYVANGVTQASNVVFSNYSATEVGRPDGAAASTSATKKGDFASFTVTDTTNYYVSGSASHSNGDMPLTYLKNEYPSGQIKAKDLSAVSSSAVTGYRPIFYGMSTGTGALDSDAVRALTKIDAAPVAQTLTFKAADLSGVKRFLIAMPTAKSFTVKKATITSSMNADATADYTKIGTVDVKGAGNYAVTASYDIWAYAPASIASTEVHEVQIG